MVGRDWGGEGVDDEGASHGNIWVDGRIVLMVPGLHLANPIETCITCELYGIQIKNKLSRMSGSPGWGVVYGETITLFVTNGQYNLSEKVGKKKLQHVIWKTDPVRLKKK